MGDLTTVEVVPIYDEALDLAEDSFESVDALEAVVCVVLPQLL